VAAQLTGHRLAQRVVGHRADHGHVVAEAGQRHPDVGLGAAHAHFQLRPLQQLLAAGRAQAQQQLTETDDTRGHGFSCGWGGRFPAGAAMVARRRARRAPDGQRCHSSFGPAPQAPAGM